MEIDDGLEIKKVGHRPNNNDDGHIISDAETELFLAKNNKPNANSTDSWPRANHDGSGRQPPKDRYNLVLFILILHGVGTLTPWNMFITAEKYFTEYKLNPQPVNATAVQELNGTSTNSTLAARDDTNTQFVSSYRNDFLSYVGVASQVPNVICSALNLLVQFGGGNLTFRITIAILVEVVVFIITIILAIVDSSSWPGEFFYITMLTVVVINIAGGVYQNSVYGLAAKFPPKYSGAVVLGTNISGTITSLAVILSIALAPNLKVAAIYYFLTALFILLICFDTYFGLPLNKFYRFYCNDRRFETETNSPRRAPPYLFVFKRTWMQCINVFMVFFVTLSVFPAVLANIKPLDKKFFGTGQATDNYFTAITCFLVFNFFALVGNLIPKWCTLPGPKYLWIPVFARLLLIPFFLFCNYQAGVDVAELPLRKWPVLIANDYIYIAGGVVLGVTSGYFSSLSMMFAPGCVPPEHAGTAGMMAAFFLILGIFSGINFSFFLSWLVKQPWF